MQTHPLPDWCTPHTAILRKFLGQGGMGPSYADPVEIRCFVLDEVKLVRNTAGDEVVSSSTVSCNFDVDAPPGSLVTVWPGLPGQRQAEVISAGRAAHERLPAFQTIHLT